MPDVTPDGTPIQQPPAGHEDATPAPGQPHINDETRTYLDPDPPATAHAAAADVITT